MTPELDDYLGSLRGLRLDGFLLARAERPWSVTRGCLSSCVVEHGVDAAPWAARGVTAPGAFTFAFAGGPGAELRVDGRATAPGALHAWRGGTRVAIVARRPADWFVVTVGEAALRAPFPANDAGGGSTPGSPPEPGRLPDLATRALRAAEAAGAAGASPEAVSLERDLLRELAGWTGAPASSRRQGGANRIDRCPVLEKIDALLDERPSEPLYVADLCAATGLPERTLRYVLVEEYGVSPIRFLRSRRLCQLRRSLRSDETRNESLARIAERHGFRHMGSFASDYRRLFGELPSETRRSSSRPARAGAPADAAPRDAPKRSPEAAVGGA
ncbi:MAG: helix-turn-helix domain-containing protein [Thermoanaerobaculia bacterium]